MKFIFLLPLLAFFQTFPRLARPAVCRRPIHSWLNKFSRKIISLLLSLPICEMWAGEEATSYRFFNNEMGEISEGVSSQSGKGQVVTAVQGGNAGVYTCQYSREESGEKILSGDSNSIQIPVVDSLLPPKLSLDPLYAFYFQGEHVTLRCSAPLGQKAEGYRFFKQSGEQIVEVFPHHKSNDQFFITAELGDAGIYICEYWRWESGRMIPSRTSDPVSISVSDSPVRPRLTVTPDHPIYMTGESITLMCSAPTNATVLGFRFFRDGQNTGSPLGNGSAQLPLLRMEIEDAGSYTCDFWGPEAVQEIPLEQSAPVQIILIDAYTPPMLIMDPPSKVVSEGYPLSFTCIAPWKTEETSFHFYKDGTKIVPGNTRSEMSSTERWPRNVFKIPEVGLNISGEFTCMYEENMSGRWISSPWSPAVNVTVIASSRVHALFWLRSLVVGASFFIINSLIFLIFHCCL
ncbi:hypothetical protein Y1Q_0010612 [Alligator mississippiensis]|uniref:Ig-like domain-containing protein n=1 Tax=Alligator mississippiensis TaxID=8496 RepID=A0A151PGK7_ALLMI|nr:hypothetical protein Y1Q_0010612 [Alligator mississippiensis]